MTQQIEKRWIWPFELEEQIGAGGMGVVYRARFVKNNRRVALKLLPPDVARNSTICARFERELEILKDLRHPHIVHCFGGTTEGDNHYYAMELVEGGTVESLLRDRDRLTWELVIDYTLQVCAALSYAHAQGVVHRDLKPGNLLLTSEGKIKLGDFGLALVASENKLTADGKTLGTLHYMAPEQIRGNPPISDKTDLYALGCVLFEMLTGRPPFLGKAAGEILHQHLHDAPPRVGTLALDCPSQLETLISDLLEKDPALRPVDAMEVASRLREVRQTVTVRQPHSDGDSFAPTRQLNVESGGTATMTSALNWPMTVGLMLLTALLVWGFASWNQDRNYARAETLLTAALKDPDVAVRKSAARLLGELGPVASGTLPALVAALNDSDTEVRTQAARAIGKLGFEARSAMPHLTKQLRNDAQAPARDAASESLKALKDAKPGRSYGSWITLLVILTAIGGGGYWYWRQMTAAT